MTADEMHDQNMQEFAEALGECAEALQVKRKANHTLGPWYKQGAEIKVSQPWRSHLGDGAPETICEMISSVSPEATEANAHLIAASPDLYRACHMLMLAYEGGEDGESVDWEDLDDVVEAAREAMAKAEGVPAG